MESSVLPLILLLMSNSYSAQRPDKPVLTVNPETSPIFRGETVTLTCDIQGTRVTWTYRFQCDGVCSVYQDSNDKEIKFTAMYSGYSRRCMCYAIGSFTQFSTSWSNEVSFTVIERPKPEVRVNPDHHVFRGETVTLTCDIQTQTHTEWRYSWIKDDSVNPVNSESSDAAGTKTIRSVKVSDGGQYRCSAQRGNYDTQFSNTVQVTVEDSKLNPELTSDTAGAALTGNTVTLICHMTQTAGWDFYWYKHTQNSEKNKTETNSYRVHIDSVSDGGQYWCRAGRGEPVYYTNYSDALWVSVTGSSSHPVIWVVAGLSVAVLLLISLILLWRYKHNKDQQCINQQTSVQNQRTRPGESPTENCPLQSGCDPIYDEVETNYKKSTGASADEVTYSELTIKNKISVDKDAGKRDVLIEMKTEDNQRGKSSECEDTVYSDLKQNTDRGGSAGVDATYAQVFNHRKKKTCKN
ncbi:Fc receptor-like protein 5 [Xyrauchen texanus]|uniref:Fc receptor-like protein 5 n=1 Tax=Xyrauchen texanus TaxID=154827 RepID=UPI0022427F42|nr:Fc receptor-like protein 5 [Xyrauchen texanus]